MGLLNRLNNLIRKTKRNTKFFWQRCRRGFDDSEAWSLDQSLARVILPRLKEIAIARPS
jgi:hypothetical protein